MKTNKVEKEKSLVSKSEIQLSCTYRVWSESNVWCEEEEGLEKTFSSSHFIRNRYYKVILLMPIDRRV